MAAICYIAAIPWIMHPNQNLIHQFYTAFELKDYAAMQALYHPDARFSDPVFPHLDSDEVKAMWEMLVKSAKDLRIACSDVVANDSRGNCRWDAWYTFSRTGRKVHNIIHADFEFSEGRIIRHCDAFDFWRWSRQALGLPGILLGWSPIIKKKVRETARNGLNKFRGTEIE